MKWVEIIKVRTSGEQESQIVHEVLEDFSAMDSRKQPAAIKLYRHAIVENDFSIHIYWDSDSMSPRKSALGLSIVDATSELGMGNHSIWIENERSAARHE